MAGPMGGQPGSGGPALPATANVVGNAFVNQYYHVLHQSPQVVHRFYTNVSKLTRAEAGADGAVDTAESQTEIHNKVMLLDYSDFKAEIKTVDSQDSHEGGVIVMVTGSLSSKTSGKRNFVQTFFLAPQEKGYFVLNDIFRYLDESPQVVGPTIPLSNGIPEPPQIHIPQETVMEPALPAEHEVREQLSSTPASEDEAGGEESIYDLPERVEISEAEDDVAGEDIVHVHHGDVPSPVLDDPVSTLVEPAAAQPPLEESTPGDIPKKSYASILRHMKEGGGHLPLPVYTPVPKPSPPTPERPVAVSAPPAPLPIQTPLLQDSFEDNIPLESEADGRSVYVKNLPLNVTATQLEEEFARFGPVKPSGVNVKSQKQQGVCYAFVEFEDTTSAVSAIEAGTIAISGRQSYIEEKRPMTSRGGGRGRLPAGRGDRPYRSDGLRGRGSFLGGRGGLGGGRGGAQDRDGAYRGRGGGQSRGGYGGGPGGPGSNSNNVSSNITTGENNYRRNDSQGGIGSRPVRRGPGNQMPRNVPLAHDSPPAVPTA